MSWRELEPEEGRYDFGVITKKIEQRAAEGYRRFELHLQASVWSMEFVDGEKKDILPEKLTEMGIIK